jgi:hypothetical protein
MAEGPLRPRQDWRAPDGWHHRRGLVRVDQHWLQTPPRPEGEQESEWPDLLPIRFVLVVAVELFEEIWGCGGIAADRRRIERGHID